MNSWSLEVILTLLVGGLAAYLLARFLMLRGFRTLGLGAGFLLLAMVVGWRLSQEEQSTRLSLSRLAPAARSPEGINLHPCGWQLYGVVALVLYVFFTRRAISRLPASAPASPSRSQKRWMAIVLVVTAAAVIVGIALQEQGISRRKQLERTTLLTEMHQVDDVITTAYLRELGSVPLSIPPNTILYEFPSVAPGGLRFSGDGRWLSLQYSGKVELWRVDDLEVGRTLEGKASDDSLVAFSPDSSLWAVWINQLVSAYALGDDVSRPVWQVSRETGPVWESLREEPHTPGSMAFSADSGALILSVPGGVVSLDARTGRVMAGGAPAQPQGFGAFVISRYGEYLATCSPLVVQVYERRGGQLVSQFEFPPELQPGEHYDTYHAGASFLADNSLLLWNAKSSSKRAVVWNTETGAWTWITLRFIDRGLSSGLLALSPDSRFAVISEWDQTILWDLTAQSKVGPLPVDYETMAVTAVAFSPDQRLLAVATADGRVRFFAAEHE